MMLVIAASESAFAQQPAGEVVALPSPAATTKVAMTTVAKSVGEDDRYRIGPGDVLDIRVFNRPTLSREAVRVDGRGQIRMPLIEEEIVAACRTEGELAREIAARYLKYQRNPNIDVFVKEYNSQPVAVIGAVNQPGRFQLQKRMRLLDLISYAGGPNDRAGGRINIVRTIATLSCDTPTSAQRLPPACNPLRLQLTM
jgi:polysaccharide export outer membrane protein